MICAKRLIFSLRLSPAISDRVDDQTRVPDRVNKTATEARSAAFAAQKQTDPEHYGEIVGATIDGRIGDSLGRVGQMAGDLLRASNHTQEVLRKAEDARSDTMRQLWEREQKLDRFKSRLPWFGLGAVVLALLLTVTLPRFLASNASTHDPSLGRLGPRQPRVLMRVCSNSGKR